MFPLPGPDKSNWTNCSLALSECEQLFVPLAADGVDVSATLCPLRVYASAPIALRAKKLNLRNMAAHQIWPDLLKAPTKDDIAASAPMQVALWLFGWNFWASLPEKNARQDDCDGRDKSNWTVCSSNHDGHIKLSLYECASFEQQRAHRLLSPLLRTHTGGAHGRGLRAGHRPFRRAQDIHGSAILGYLFRYEIYLHCLCCSWHLVTKISFVCASAIGFVEIQGFS